MYVPTYPDYPGPLSRKSVHIEDASPQEQLARDMLADARILHQSAHNRILLCANSSKLWRINYGS